MAEDTPRKKTLGQRLMDTLTKDYVYTVHPPEGLEEKDQTEPPSRVRSLNPRKDAEIDKAADEIGKKKGGIVRVRGVGCARKGHGKGTMR